MKLDRPTIKRIAERYASTGTRFYLHGKLGSDPICSQVLDLAGELGGLGEVVDVGCGRGQMGVLLAELGLCSRAHGFDWDEEKVAEATAAAGDDARLSFAKGDTRAAPIPPCDSVLMLDVLHYLTEEEQDALVVRAATAARRAIVVRELDPDRGWRSATTRAQESVTTFFGYNVGARVLVRPISAITDRLTSQGFAVRVLPSWGSTPFANVAVIGTR